MDVSCRRRWSRARERERGKQRTNTYENGRSSGVPYGCDFSAPIHFRVEIGSCPDSGGGFQAGQNQFHTLLTRVGPLPNHAVTQIPRCSSLHPLSIFRQTDRSFLSLSLSHLSSSFRSPLLFPPYPFIRGSSLGPPLVRLPPPLPLSLLGPRLVRSHSPSKIDHNARVWAKG